MLYQLHKEEGEASCCQNSHSCNHNSFGIEFFGFNFHCPLLEKKIKEDCFIHTVVQQSISKNFITNLRKATQGFSKSNIIDIGSYGSVYKGVLDQDSIPFVEKVFNL